MFKILLKGKVKMVTADSVKPAHIDREPEPGTTQKHQIQPRSLPSANKPAAIACKPCTARAQPRSTIIPQPLKTGVHRSGRTTSTQSPKLEVGSSPAIAPRSNTSEARLPNPPTLYKAPHGSRRTYSRVPLHLRKDATDTKTLTSRTNVKSSTSTVHNDKANADKIVTQTRV